VNGAEGGGGVTGAASAARRLRSSGTRLAFPKFANLELGVVIGLSQSCLRLGPNCGLFFHPNIDSSWGFTTLRLRQMPPRRAAGPCHTQIIRRATLSVCQSERAGALTTLGVPAVLNCVEPGADSM